MNNAYDRLIQRHGYILFGLFALLSAWTILARSLPAAVAFSAIDDAMYYPKVAAHLAREFRSTYDGVTLTNGYHPLWMVCLVPIYWLFSDPFVALKAVYFLVFAVLTAVTFLFARVSRLAGFAVSGMYVAYFVLLLNFRSFIIFFSLLESALVLLCYFSVLYFSLRTGANRFLNARLSFVNGLLIGLCFLARIDAFLLAGTYGLALLAVGIRHRMPITALLRSALAAAAGASILVLPYLAINMSVWGHFSTVSAHAKQVHPSLENFLIIGRLMYLQFIPRVSLVTNIPVRPLCILLACGALVAAGLAAWRVKQNPNSLKRLFPIADFMLFAGLHLIFIVMMAPSEAVVSAWYWVPEIVAVTLLVGALIGDLSLRGIKLIPLAIAAVVLLQLAWYPFFIKKKTMTWAKLDVAEFIRTQMPTSMRGLMYDSGIVAYFSDRDFVSLNGLIGDFEQSELCTQKRITELATRYGINTLVIDVPDTKLDFMSNRVVYVSQKKTLFTNFQEAPKHFVVYSAEPAELEAIWNYRYSQ